MIAKSAEINLLTQFEVSESRHSLFVLDTVDLYSVCGARLYNRTFIHYNYTYSLKRVSYLRYKSRFSRTNLHASTSYWKFMVLEVY